MEDRPRRRASDLDENCERGRIIYCYALLSQTPTSVLGVAFASGTKAVHSCLTPGDSGGRVRGTERDDVLHVLRSQNAHHHELPEHGKRAEQSTAHALRVLWCQGPQHRGMPEDMAWKRCARLASRDSR
jgi:hypothetical protein